MKRSIFAASAVAACFATHAYAQAVDCNRTDYVVNADAQGPQNAPDTRCTAERCSVEGAFFEAVEAANTCGAARPNRRIVLQAGETYEFFRARTGAYYADRQTALATLSEGNFTIDGNGATLYYAHGSSTPIRFMSTNGRAQVVIKNLTLRGGRATASHVPGARRFDAADGHGPALINRGAMVLINVTLEDNLSSASNSARNNGASWTSGLFNRGDLDVIDSEIRDAIYNEGGLRITNTDFKGAVLVIGDNSRGVGAGPAVVVDSSFSDGSWINTLSSVRVENTMFHDNGSAVLTAEAPVRQLLPRETILEGAWARTYQNSLNIDIERSSFVRGFYSTPTLFLPQGAGASAVTMTVTASTIAENSSPSPQIACLRPDSRIALRDVTIADNINTIGGAPSSFAAANGCRMQISNSVISGAGVLCGIEDDVAEYSVQNSFASDNSCRASATGDARLSALAFNGGSTLNMAPASGSPLIDAGLPARAAYYADRRCDDEDYRFQAEEAGAPCRLVEERDQRGFPRNAGERKDIGAIEVQSIRARSATRPSLQLSPAAPAIDVDKMRERKRRQLNDPSQRKQ